MPCGALPDFVSILVESKINISDLHIHCTRVLKFTYATEEIDVIVQCPVIFIIAFLTFDLLRTAKQPTKSFVSLNVKTYNVRVN